jgi:integrase
MPNGGTFGDLPLGTVTLDHCEHVMRKLPETTKRRATRRQYAQVIRRVLELAVHPCRLIPQHPLPRTFMPKVGKPPAFSFLYPDEEAALMACAAVPLEYRTVWGFLSREGCRVGEALGARLGVEIDLERGTFSLDVNKTHDARTWPLDPAVRAALAAYVKLKGIEKGALMFTDEHGRAHESDKLAERLRAHLWAAGVRRPELHESGENRNKLRAHDLRGTFVTLSLANGKTETWVADRTGHKSSIMINRYRRAARSVAELELGPLAPLNVAVPEIIASNPESAGGGQPGGQREPVVNSVALPAEVETSNDSAAVPKVGLEPTRLLGQRILSPPRLPIPPLRLVVRLSVIASAALVKR